MKLPALLFGGPLSRALAVTLLLPAALFAAERSLPPVIGSAAGSGLAAGERDALVSWTMAQPSVQAAVARHRTRLLRVWLDLVKGEGGSHRRATLLLRDYDAGSSREITVDLATGQLGIRDLPGVQPSEEEIAEGMEIARRDPALARFVRDPRLTLMGGFYNVSIYPDDPCSREICLEFAFMKPSFEKNPTRHLIVNLTRGIVSHHDFRSTRAGGPAPRMSEEPER
jgi:hypothetical protein